METQLLLMKAMKLKIIVHLCVKPNSSLKAAKKLFNAEEFFNTTCNTRNVRQ